MLRIYPDSLYALRLQWDGMKGDYFTILRSTSPQDGYEVLESNYKSPIYVDENVNLYEIGKRYYYKIEGFYGGVLVDKVLGETPVYNKRDPVAGKVVYESRVVLNVMRNPPVKILLKRRSGKDCPSCWNPITKKVRFADCEMCKGTGIQVGYHNPITAKISRDISQLIDYGSMLDGDKINKTNVNAWITNTPLVSPGDVIVDVMNERFRIDRVTQRTRSQYIIRQILDLTPLEKGHPAYGVNVEWGDAYDF